MSETRKRVVGILAHRTRLEALEFAEKVIEWLEVRDIEVRLDRDAADKLGKTGLASADSVWREVEFIITLGGDGTILTAARLAAPMGIPILGVHMGQFGFIAETHPGDLFPHLEEILAGQIQIEERLMLQADIIRNGETFHTGSGLNDVALKSKMSRLLHLKTYLSGELFATYPADGVVISTPTGSTGYALSAGGPLVEPSVQVFLLVPICPHTLSARPMIVPAHETIEIEIEVDGDDVIFAIDGVEPLTLESGDRVVVRKADYATKIILLNHGTFYDKVRKRYLYGERVNA